VLFVGQQPSYLLDFSLDSIRAPKGEMSFLTGAFRAAGDFLEAVDESAGERLGDKSEQQLPLHVSEPGATAARTTRSAVKPEKAMQPNQHDAVREREALRREVSSLQRRLIAGSADLDSEKSRSAALKSQVEAAYKDMANLKQTVSELKEDLASVDESAMQTLRSEVRQLRDEATASKQNSRQQRGSSAAELAAARQEATATSEALSAALQDVRDARMAGDSKEATLREEISGLASRLAAAQVAAAAAASSQGTAASSRNDTDDASALAVAQAELQAEHRVLTVLKADLSVSRRAAEAKGAEATQQRMAAATANSRLDALQQQLQVAEGELKATCGAAQEAERLTASTAQLTGRVKQLSRNVIEKQDTLDALQAERTALARRVGTLEARLQAAEAAAAQGGASVASPTDSPWGAEEGGLKRRGGATALSAGWRGTSSSGDGGGGSMARLPVISKHARLSAAAGSVDASLRSAGALLSTSPAARALLVGYLIALHLWVLLSTAFHAHAVVHEGVQHPESAPGGA
jgi:chromosome segregation ATPase